MARRAPGLSPEDRVKSLLADIEALPARRTGKRADIVKVQTDFVDSGHEIIVQAALDRRISIPAYVRRAAYAMACHDLDIPLSTALERDPRMARNTGLSVPDPAGNRFGPWEIESLRDAPRP